MSWRSIPNLLGLFRIVTTPLLVALILSDTLEGYAGAVILLLLMAISDIADGRIARRLKIVSRLGVFLDTISDKIFVAGALLPMIELQLLPSWIALVIITRDFAVSGLRSYAASEGLVIAARQWGKQKLVITVIALVWCLVDAALDRAPAALPPLALLGSLWPLVMGLAVAWTIFSGVEYFWKAWPLLSEQWSPSGTDSSASSRTTPDALTALDKISEDKEEEQSVLSR